MRQQVVVALAELADPEYQQQEWIDYDTVLGASTTLDVTVHVLYDDCAVLPDPDKALWTVLLPGAELHRLRALDRILGPVIDDLGSAPIEAYLADRRWPGVVAAAMGALTAMVLNGGFTED